jgi:hypothetical protein
MKKNALGFVKNFLPLFIGLFLIYHSYNNSSPVERQEIYNSLKYADYKYIVLSVFLAILSHLSRSLRWQYLLNPIGYNISFSNSIMAVLVSYLSNLSIPRSGEFLRASTITLYEKVPFEKGFGTIITERIIDVIILLTCILIGISIFPFIRQFMNVDRNWFNNSEYKKIKEWLESLIESDLFKKAMVKPNLD